MRDNASLGEGPEKLTPDFAAMLVNAAGRRHSARTDWQS
jgi:hypothetical protein